MAFCGRSGNSIAVWREFFVLDPGAGAAPIEGFSRS